MLVHNSSHLWDRKVLFAASCCSVVYLTVCLVQLCILQHARVWCPLPVAQVMRIVDVPVVSTVIATLAHVIAYTRASEHFRNRLAVVYIQEVKCSSL